MYEYIFHKDKEDCEIIKCYTYEEIMKGKKYNISNFEFIKKIYTDMKDIRDDLYVRKHPKLNVLPDIGIFHNKDRCGYSLSVKDNMKCNCINNNLIIINENVNQKYYLVTLAHELRHLFQSKNLRKNYSRNYREFLFHRAEIDADAYSYVYLSKKYKKPIINILIEFPERYIKNESSNLLIKITFTFFSIVEAGLATFLRFIRALLIKSKIIRKFLLFHSAIFDGAHAHLLAQE